MSIYLEVTNYADEFNNGPWILGLRNVINFSFCLQIRLAELRRKRRLLNDGER
jgi:hypothetical protein